MPKLFLHFSDDIYPDEMEDYLADILNTEFDLIVEDGSTAEVDFALFNPFPLRLSTIKLGGPCSLSKGR